MTAWLGRHQMLDGHPADGSGDAAGAGARIMQASALADGGDVQAALRLCRPEDAIHSPGCTELLVQTLEQTNPRAARDWLQTLPPSAAKDRGLSTLARWHDDSPSDAKACVEQIGDATLREQAAERTFEKWNATDPAAARAWIGNLSAVDEAWRARYLRMNP
jgi:hypothetical protein